MNMKRLLLVLMVAALSLPVFSGLADEKPQEYIPSQVIVSMGDSFSSGEGIPPFYGQMDENGKEKTLREKLADQDWLAHRSMNSWGGQLELVFCRLIRRHNKNRA